jgi:hypothetical protein
MQVLCFNSGYMEQRDPNRSIRIFLLCRIPNFPVIGVDASPIAIPAAAPKGAPRRPQ